MKTKKITLKYKNKKIEIEAKKCNLFQKAIGLMFKSKNTHALLFEFNNPSKELLHSFFVFFPFLAIWLNEKNQILEIQKISPFRPHISIKKPFSKIIEIPLNKKYQKQIKILVGEQKI